MDTRVGYFSFGTSGQIEFDGDQNMYFQINIWLEFYDLHLHFGDDLYWKIVVDALGKFVQI